VEVIDSVQDYCQLMKEIFDFGALKATITGTGGSQKVNVLANALSGGLYAGSYCSSVVDYFVTTSAKHRALAS